MVHDDHVVGDLHRLLLIVRDEDRRRVRLVVQTPQPAAELTADACVEGAERLVQQQHLRLGRERTGERHSLPLAARQLSRIAVAEPFELHEREQLGDARADLVARPLAHLQAERDVVANRHVLERGVVLEDEPDAALLRGERGRVLAGEQDLAAVRPLEARDDPEQRRLARPGGAEQRGQRPAFDLDRDIVERLEVTEALRDVADLNAHREMVSFGFKRVIATRTSTDRTASTSEMP